MRTIYCTGFRNRVVDIAGESVGFTADGFSEDLSNKLHLIRPLLAAHPTAVEMTPAEFKKIMEEQKAKVTVEAKSVVPNQVKKEAPPDMSSVLLPLLGKSSVAVQSPPVVVESVPLPSLPPIDAGTNKSDVQKSTKRREGFKKKSVGKV
jgi:hypothetical protein